ncbi:MAG: hypothetical protein K8S98_03525 [Planctomycetes bacterium]|nr:hypothetical protein [Planctomycetota bacterium]
MSSRVVLWCLALFVALHSLAIVVQSFAPQRGIDFYHYWGIPAARELAGAEELGTPYANGPRYAAILNRAADASSDRHFQQANAERRSIDPTGTPFFYLCFAALPDDFTTAHLWFRAGQWLCLWLALFWFACQVGIDRAVAAVLAGLVPAFLYPFHSDLAVGNVNTYQLLACVALAWLATTMVRGRSLAIGCVLAAGLVALVVFKPNLAPVSAALALVVWTALGVRRASLASLVGLGGGAVCVALSCAYFGGWRAWSEWYAFLHGPTGSKVADYAVTDGNHALSVVLVDHGGNPNYASDTYRLSVVVAVLLAVSWIVAVFVGRRGRTLVARWREVGTDAQLVLCSALVFTLAASPLVWVHYGVFALPPIVWCLRPGTHAALRRTCGVVALAAYGSSLAPLVGPLGYKLLDYGPYVDAFAWVPLWLVVLAELVRPRAAVE